MAEPEDTEEELEEQDEEEDEDEEEEEERQRQEDMAARRNRQNQGQQQGAPGQQQNQGQQGGQQGGRPQRDSNSGFRGWLKSLGPEAIRMILGRAVGKIVAHGFATEHVNLARAWINQYFTDETIKNRVIPMLQVGLNVTPFLPDWMSAQMKDVLEDTVNDTFVEVYREYDHVDGVASHEKPRARPYLDALSELHAEQRLLIDGIAELMEERGDEDAKKAWAAFRGRLLYPRDFESLIVRCRQYVEQNGAPVEPLQIRRYLERTYGKVAPPIQVAGVLDGFKKKFDGAYKAVTGFIDELEDVPPPPIPPGGAQPVRFRRKR